MDIDNIGGSNNSVSQPASPFTPSSTQPCFGLIIPGCNVRTDFTQVDSTKFSLTLTCPGDVPVPLQSVREIVLFSASDLPPDHGVLCYWQISAASNPLAPNSFAYSSAVATGFELLGGLSTSQPSAVFQTGWSENQQVVELTSKNGVAVPVTITIGISYEPAANLLNIGATESKVEQGKLFVAKQIATDLFTFMQSFDTGTSGTSMMVVPNNIFDRWFQRFENRFKRDPNFFMKHSN